MSNHSDQISSWENLLFNKALSIKLVVKIPVNVPQHASICTNLYVHKCLD